MSAIKTVAAFLLGLFLAPTVASVVGFIFAFVFALVRMRSRFLGILVRAIWGSSEGILAVAFSALVFRLFAVEVSWLLIAALAFWYGQNDLRRLAQKLPEEDSAGVEMRQLRIVDSASHLSGIVCGGVYFLYL